MEQSSRGLEPPLINYQKATEIEVGLLFNLRKKIRIQKRDLQRTKKSGLIRHIRFICVLFCNLC